MAFPQVQAVNVTDETSDVTSHDVNMTGVAAGYRAIMFAVIDNDGTSVTISDMPAGWTQIERKEGLSGGGRTTEIWEKVNCTGAESSFQFTSSSSQKSVNALVLVSGSHASQAMEGPGGVLSSPPDPPSHTASWGAEDNLWIAFIGTENRRDDVTTYPTNYDDNQSTIVNGADNTTCNYGLCTRELNTATEDPGAFNSMTDGAQDAFTFAVRPLLVRSPRNRRLFLPRRSLVSRHNQVFS